MGIGPGGAAERTPRADRAIAQSDVIVGYSRYVRLIKDLCVGKETLATGMTREVERCRAAIERAQSGSIVALISSGDPGVYGMAGLAIELAEQMAPELEIEVVPGITAANAAAARMGAPLMLDYAVISLSDLLVPWEMIRQRLEAVASADLVAVLYNPRSRKRVRQLEETVEIFQRYHPTDTPVGIGTAISTPDEHIVLTNLGSLLAQEVNMKTVVIIGNTQSTKLKRWFLTPRGYTL